MINSSNQQIKEKSIYFHKEIQPIFTKLITRIVANRPQDILQYSWKYFQQQNNKALQYSDRSQDDEISQLQFNKIRDQKLRNKRYVKRLGVSGEANNMMHLNRKPINIRKSCLKQEKTQMMIKFYFICSFLFKDFYEEEKNSIIDNMHLRKTGVNQVVLEEGEYGDCMYFVENGIFQCSVKRKDSSDDSLKKYVKNYQQGDYFGQICLLHRSQRHATITSLTQGNLYVLTRQAYKQIKKMSVCKKRLRISQKIANIAIFSNFNREEIQKLCDLFQQVEYKAGQYVVYEGDIGNKFYVVIQGLLIAKNNSQQIFYQYYKESDYFGELALLHKQPRQLSVQTITSCKLIWITREIFLNIINKDKVDLQIKNKYKDNKLVIRPRKKRTAQSYF